MANPTVDELLAFVGLPISQHTQAELAMNTAISLVEGYTRGKCRIPTTNEFRPGVGEVVLAVSARLVANPEQISHSEQSGAYRVSKGVGFQGFTLAELAVLNRYRKRSM